MWTNGDGAAACMSMKFAELGGRKHLNRLPIGWPESYANIGRFDSIGRSIRPLAEHSPREPLL